MTSVAEALLEHAVRADAWLRTTDSPLVHPLAALLLTVLVGLLVLAIRHAIRWLGLAAARCAPAAAAPPRGRASDAPPLATATPRGGRGARAPARRPRRSTGLLLAH